MALTIGDNFSYQGVKPLDGRIKYNTLAEMVAMADSTLYDGCIAYCVGEDKNYQWKSTNTVDATTGKWRELEAGGENSVVEGYAYQTLSNDFDDIVAAFNSEQSDVILTNQWIYSSAIRNAVFFVNTTNNSILVAISPKQLKISHSLSDRYYGFRAANTSESFDIKITYPEEISYTNHALTLVDSSSGTTVADSSVRYWYVKLYTTDVVKAYFVGDVDLTSFNDEYTQLEVRSSLVFYEDSAHTIPIIPEEGKIYVDKTANKFYRWDGEKYVEVGSSTEYTAGDGINITENEISTERMQSSEIGDLALSEPGIIPDVKITRPVVSTMDRWLRFDPDNKKGLIIKGNTYIRNSQGNYVAFYTDTAIDLTSSISTNGADYFVNMADNGTITASTSKFSTGVTIGRFHTLCVAAGTISMIAPASPNSGLTTNSYYLIKSYSETDDPDFYSFYRKKVTAISANASHYDVVTMSHPLSGFAAGSILPESVFCLTFHPECLVEDAMVYDKDTNRAIDIYLQSGTAQNTRSKYNVTHTVSRTPYNHAEDYRSVGKRLLLDNEFTSAALGSNECTDINGEADATYVGGHKDTNNRRMISAIGCEEMCGYLWQWLADLVGKIDSDTTNHWLITDGRGSFGQEYWQPYVLWAGGRWADGVRCGSRARGSSHVRSDVFAFGGGRGSSRMSRNT